MDSSQKPRVRPTLGATTAKVASVEDIKQLLKTKDDTARFVGLALLKSSLDNSAELRNDENAVGALWNSISGTFLDRLLKTGSRPGAKQADAKEMLDLAANVIYTFAVLLPDDTKSDSKLLGRVPLLVGGILQSSEATTDVILKTLLTVVSSSHEGSAALAAVEDWSPLVEIAPKQPMVLSILAWTWTTSFQDHQVAGAAQIDESIRGLCASYKGTDAVTLLEFMSKLLGRLEPELLLDLPTWLNTVVELIHKLVTMRPTAASREAFTNCAANLLVAFGDKASELLFKGIFTSAKSLPYLFMSLVLVDIRSTLPSLLGKLNTQEYPTIAERLTSGLVILSFFIDHLLMMIDRAESEDVFHQVQPDLLLKLRDSVAETLSLVMEYLRERWDAAVSGAQGLHPEARIGVVHTVSGSLKTLAWDSRHESVSEDRLLLAALKALGDWLREDDAPTLRGEATGLIDLLMDLYQPGSAARTGVATRPLVLGVVDGIIKEGAGVQTVLEHDGWTILSKDLVSILANSDISDRISHELGQHISAILRLLAESRLTTPEDWLDIVTNVAAYNVPDVQHPALSLQQLWADVLELCTLLLSHAPPGVKRRYEHSASALAGIASAIAKMNLDDLINSQISEAVYVLHGT